MNNSIRNYMRNQRIAINEALSKHSIPVYENEMAEDEYDEFISGNRLSMVVATGEIVPTGDNKSMSQAVFIEYYSFNTEDVDEKTLEIILGLNLVKAIKFVKSYKNRVQIGETSEYLDRVTLHFERKIPIGCQV